ncbi:lauroyl acyltransferase [Acidiphilium sp. PA]|uniref:lysophospholipid acyltransferase family protein n=1 Tax=Acidiphilium sp. PA TaxID=2871705 RepID=UPI0022435215|nr:lauroyl acyltransferase [Acidiphilium sp. PA]MCW8307317.1 lauroyl acyltransferase [Acidiphilium sp. PA]
MTRLQQLEYAVARLFLALFRTLSPARASTLAGALGRTIGPLIPTSRIADANLTAALPALDAQARRAIIAQVWDNLARNAGEFPHLAALRATATGPGFTITGAEHAIELAKLGGPAIILTAHCGNWEILPAALRTLGLRFAFFYRAAANPAVDQLIIDLRAAAMGEPVTMFAKGAKGARGAYAHLARGGMLCMLVDQKLNDGIPVPLFGIEAMTTPALAVFARKFRCPILPVRVERLGPARLHLIIEPIAHAAITGDKPADIAATTLWMNQTIERWVRARPGQWLWLHRRWPKNPPARVAKSTSPD